MNGFPEHVIALFRKIHPLDRVPRSGYLLRGVTEPENVAAHSHFLTLLVLLATERSPGTYDAEKAMAMAVIHDLPEAVTMDIPVPAGGRNLREAKAEAEREITEDLFRDAAPRLAEYHRELSEGTSAEARLVLAMDRVQMMLKVLCYEEERRGNLSDFWNNEKNFDSRGVPEAEELFRAIRKAAPR